MPGYCKHAKKSFRPYARSSTASLGTSWGSYSILYRCQCENDFYSHSNWVELGNQQINPDLVQPGHEIKSIAEAGVPTCSDCTDWTCEGNLLDDVASKGLLTTGYYGSQPKKPIGKCSHGGRFDDSRHREPRGGINKDSSSLFFSPHHYLHNEAAFLAQEATKHFLEKLWQEIGSKQFMRLLDISPSTGLSFVVDTTGSMGDEINAAKYQAREIIDQRRGTPQEPDFYILVPFHDPEFGPVHKTSDPEEFWKIFDRIIPLSGGDEPEMCLSALELALQYSPPYSEIFVFTDASAKDAHLKNSVESLSQEKKCKVTFLITEDPSRTRAKRETLAPDRFDLYVELAHSSGGQIIFTDDKNIRHVAKIIGESSISSVTLFRHQKGNIFSLKGVHQKIKKRATELEVHQFWIDSLVDKVVVTIQGAIHAFEIWDPSGKVQMNKLTTGPLAKIESIGGIYRAFLSSPVHAGKWTLKLYSRGHYSVYIQGQSTLDFLYYFAVPVDGRHPGLFMMDSHPVEGLPTYLVVMVMGLNQSESGSVHLQAVNLEGRTGSLGELELQGGAQRADLFVAELPPTLLTSNNFSIVVHGVDSEGRRLERAAPQAATMVGSLLELSRDTPVFPGRLVSITWKVMNPGSSKEYELKVSSVPQLAANISSSRLQLGFNQTATGQISLHVPNTTTPGSVITVTLQANLLHPDGDPGFAHIYLLVMPLPQVQIFPSPLCSVASADGSCDPPQSLCHSQHWTAILRIRDEAGIRSVQVEGGAVVPHQADGPAELVTYTSDCCSQQAQLIVTNLLGETYPCQVAAPPSTRPGKALPRPPDVKARVGPSPTSAWWCWALLTVFLTIDWLGF
ncbi:von Willebrand factor A domain-containing protein 7 isoform X4 [Sceloporus undulatus]|uniref:von Willebrand factor A domain-containing protein 7 isoform X4 n=1 Tax=Sceloporus undulatus TaxID=8520 RepID=UPI001C4C544C|nr:von Willebrand factor A domain-containing protein 7 isoform X4 [Sceloporus undulatus]